MHPREPKFARGDLHAAGHCEGAVCLVVAELPGCGGDGHFVGGVLTIGRGVVDPLPVGSAGERAELALQHLRIGLAIPTAEPRPEDLGHAVAHLLGIVDIQQGTRASRTSNGSSSARDSVLKLRRGDWAAGAQRHRQDEGPKHSGDAKSKAWAESGRQRQFEGLGPRRPPRHDPLVRSVGTPLPLCNRPCREGPRARHTLKTCRSQCRGGRATVRSSRRPGFTNDGQGFGSHGQRFGSHGQRFGSHGQRFGSHGQGSASHGQARPCHDPTAGCPRSAPSLRRPEVRTRWPVPSLRRSPACEPRTGVREPRPGPSLPRPQLWAPRTDPSLRWPDASHPKVRAGQAKETALLAEARGGHAEVGSAAAHPSRGDGWLRRLGPRVASNRRGVARRGGRPRSTARSRPCRRRRERSAASPRAAR